MIPSYIDYRALPLYEVQKQLAIRLWRLGYCPLSRHIKAVCAPCVVKGYACFLMARDEPEAHHLIIPRGYTRDLDRNVHWFWNLVPAHPGCHLLAHSRELRDDIILKQAELIGWHILHESDAQAAGLAWLQEQIDLEGLKTHIPLPLPKS